MTKTKKKSTSPLKIILTLSVLVVGTWYIFQTYFMTKTPVGINEISPTGTVSMSLSPANISLNPNQTTTISLLVDSGTSPLAALLIKLNFDSTKLTITNLVKGTWLPVVLRAPTIGAGTITAELGALNTINSSKVGVGTIFTFDVKSTVPGTHNISFDIPFNEAGVNLEGLSNTNMLKSATGATITINSIPTITTQPSSTQTVLVGANATLSVTGAGTPAPTYQWYKGTTALTGKTTASLTLSNVQLVDAGSYKVTLTNSAGSVTSNTSTLTVNSPVILPAITTQPESLPIVREESAITLSVVATGTAPLTYQWYKGTTALAGKTASSLTISSAKTTLSTTPDTGVYTVKVTNSSGTTTSNPSTLSVKPKADIIGTNRAVDDSDFIAFIQYYNTPGSIADVNGSGSPDIYDFTKLISQYNLSW